MPEEHNRVIADHVGDFLLTPSRDADMNLIREGIDPSRIEFVGNTMIDSLLQYRNRAAELDIASKELGVSDYILVTLHRPALVDDAVALVEVMDLLEEIARERPVVFPMHPRTLGVLKAAGWHPSSVLLLEPQSYLRFLSLELGAWAVLTDSGGIQEETTVLGIPCFTLRTTTERPVTVSEGTNQVLGIGRDALAAFRAALGGPLDRQPSTPEGWDGRAAARAAAALVRRYGTERAETPALALG
jgi:UDP-N-acetylglucosamine 2-epimerase (non-hydrolysing)